MKKVIATILTIITAIGFTVGIVGCKKVEYPEFTAEAPVYDYYIWQSKTRYIFKIPYANGTEFYEAVSLDYYDEFLEFYNGEYKKLSEEAHYLLNPPSTDPTRIPSDTSFCVYFDVLEEESKALDEFYIYEQVKVYQEGLDRRYDQESLNKGGRKWTVNFECILPPVEKDYGNDYTLEFGESNIDNYNYNYFINVYAEEGCIGTIYCRVRDNKKIPLSWFKEYFATNLYYGG